MNIQDFNILYINLKEHEKRNKIFINNFAKYNITTKRIEAINGKKLGNKQYRKYISKQLNIPEHKLEPEWWLNRSNFNSLSRSIDNILPRVGLFLTHIKCLLYALNNNYNGVVLLEDDSIPLSNVKQKLTIPKNTDIYYLGGTFSQIEKPNVKNINKKYIRCDPNKFKLYGTFAMLIPNYNKIYEILNVLYSVFNEGKSKDKHPDWRTGNIKLRALSIDRFYVNHFQKNGYCYVINKVRFTHPEGNNDNSTINNKKFNYKKHKLTFYYHPEQNKYV